MSQADRNLARKIEQALATYLERSGIDCPSIHGERHICIAGMFYETKEKETVLRQDEGSAFVNLALLSEYLAAEVT